MKISNSVRVLRGDESQYQSIARAWFYCVRPPFTTSPRPQMASFTCLYFSPADTFLISLKLNLDGHSLSSPLASSSLGMHTQKSSVPPNISPRGSNVVTQLMALSPSKFLFYVLHCFHYSPSLYAYARYGKTKCRFFFQWWGTHSSVDAARVK